MTFDEYQQAAMRTASMRIGAETEMCIRALGLCGEATELEEACGDDERIKECGDVLWYTATLAQSFGISGKDLKFTNTDLGAVEGFSGDSIESLAGKLAELVKKEIGHRKIASRTKVAHLIGQVLERLALHYPDLNEVAETNVAKLRARYPEGFSTAIASVKPDSAP